jgi:hypothetical protein
VLDALAPLGVRHLDMPFTPEKVWQALAAPEARQVDRQVHCRRRNNRSNFASRTAA